MGFLELTIEEAKEAFAQWLTAAKSDSLAYDHSCLCLMDRTGCGGHIVYRGMDWPVYWPEFMRDARKL